jgi:hypothetical protein
MQMDAGLTHLLTKLDKIHDTQRDHGEILNHLKTARTSDMVSNNNEKNDTRWLKLPPFSQMIVGGMASWAVGTAIGSFIRHGGDPVVIIEAVLKLLF